MSYPVQPPAVTPDQPRPSGPPSAVTAASALLWAMAVAGLTYAAITIAVVPGVVHRFRSGVTGDDVDGYVSVIWLGAAVALAVAVILFALYIVLGVGLRRGNNGARVATLAISVLGLLGGALAAITVWIQRSGDSPPGSLGARLSGAYPGGWIGTNVGLAIAQIVAYAVVLTLVLRAPRSFFGGAPDRPAAHHMPPVYGGAYPPPQPGYPTAYAAPGQPAYGAPGQPAYGVPGQPAYGAPGQPAYGAPGQPAYGAPGQPAYGAPGQPGYAAPGQPGYGAPGQFGHPGHPGYGAPGQPGYGTPGQPTYGAPGQPGYGTPGQPAYGAPGQPGYGMPGQSGYAGSGQPGYGAPGQPAHPGEASRAGEDPSAGERTAQPGVAAAADDDPGRPHASSPAAGAPSASGSRESDSAGRDRAAVVDATPEAAPSNGRESAGSSYDGQSAAGSVAPAGGGHNPGSVPAADGRDDDEPAASEDEFWKRPSD